MMPERSSDENVDRDTVQSFGSQWQRFDQQAVPEGELRERFEQYFRIFPWTDLPHDASGFDLGCGTGRWAKFVAPRVGTLHCIDPSAEALDVARRTLEAFSNCRFIEGDADGMGVADASMDFGYSLGVLHHLPDPARGLRACVDKLRTGAPFLVYLYYALDDRPRWFRAMFRTSDAARRIVHRLPEGGKRAVTTAVAALAYWPLARTAAVVERFGRDVSGFPLSYYRRLSFYTMRTDARDRLGTPIEHRFSKAEMRDLMSSCGLTDIAFSDEPPFWCALGRRA